MLIGQWRLRWKMLLFIAELAAKLKIGRELKIAHGKISIADNGAWELLRSFAHYGTLCPRCGSRNWGPTPVWMDTGLRCDVEEHVCFACGKKWSDGIGWAADNLCGTATISEPGIDPRALAKGVE